MTFGCELAGSWRGLPVCAWWRLRKLGMRTEKKMKKYSVKPSGFWYSFGQLRDDRLTALYSGVKILGSELEGYPSGQRDQTVNLTALPSKVRILLPPPVFRV